MLRKINVLKYLTKIGEKEFVNLLTFRCITTISQNSECLSHLSSFSIFFVYWCSQPFTDSLRNRRSKKFPKILEKALWQSIVFNKVASLHPTTLIKMKLQHWCFPQNFAKFSKETIGRMPLYVNVLGKYVIFPCYFKQM